MFNVIPLVIIIVSLTVIIAVILRRYTDILMIDPDTIPRERDRKKKNQILSDRIDRKSKAIWVVVVKIFKPVGEKISIRFQDLYKKILEYERKNKRRKENRNEVPGLDASIKEIQDLASPAMSKEKNEPEQKPTEDEFIAMLEKNPKDTTAYFGLAELYKARGDIDLAKETIKYLLKLEPNNPKFLDAMVNLSIIENDKKSAQDALLRLKKVNPENRS